MINWRDELRSTSWSSLMTSMKRHAAEGDIECISMKWEIVSSMSIWENDPLCVVVHKLNMTQQYDYAAKIANPTWSFVNRSVVCSRGEIVLDACSFLITVWAPKQITLPITSQTFHLPPLQALFPATAILCWLASWRVLDLLFPMENTAHTPATSHHFFLRKQMTAGEVSIQILWAHRILDRPHTLLRGSSQDLCQGGHVLLLQMCWQLQSEAKES